MARLPYQNIEGTPFQKGLANSPKVREAFLVMENALKSVLEPELLERIRLRTASNNACHY